MLNHWSKLSAATNKLQCFRALKDVDGINIPEFTTDRQTVIDWLITNHTVCARHKLTGHSGEGLIILNPVDEQEASYDFKDAPLYTKYIKKQKEFRVHVAFGKVLDIQEKRLRRDFTGERNFTVRNHHTGWIYARGDLQPPDGLVEMALRTIGKLGLDFGAVDMIWNALHDKCYVLEVNTAPGIEGTSVDLYTNAFMDHINETSLR